MNDARSVTQDFLDRQGDATVSGDLEATLAFCDLPCTLESMEGRTIARTEADMRAICQTFIESLQARQLTHMMRRVLEAEFKDERTIWATYETRYIRSGKLLADDPYVSFIILKRPGGRWKISMLQLAASGESPANVTLRQRRPNAE